jgi:hypothetical protein
MKVKVLQFITLILLALVVGVFWGSWVGLSRSITSFNAEIFLNIGHTMIQNLASIMPLLMLLTLASMIGLLIFMDREKADFFRVGVIGFLLFVTTMLITIVVEVPIDNQIKRWTMDSLPSDWTLIRNRGRCSMPRGRSLLWRALYA